MKVTCILFFKILLIETERESLRSDCRTQKCKLNAKPDSSDIKSLNLSHELRLFLRLGMTQLRLSFMIGPSIKNVNK